MKFKKIIAMVLVVMTLVAIAVPASAAESVVDENSGWYWPTVNKTITSGFGIIRSDGAYHQGIDIRATVGTDVYAARSGTVYRSGWNDSMGKPAATTTESGFNDVTDATAFYYDAVLWAVEKGITNGISATEFGVNGICNRAQVVTFLYRTYNG